MKFGYNCDTSSVSFEFAIEAMKQSGADCHLIMISPNSFYLGTGDLATIRKYLEALPSHVKLIIRTYNTNEGDWQRYPAAIEYERHWKWIKANLGNLTDRLIFDDPANEPNLGGSDVNAAKAYVARCVELVKAASNAGVKLAIGAWSVGTPHESLFATVYTPLWWALHEYKQAISWHLYGAIPNEAGETESLEIVLNAATARNYMASDRWPIAHQGWLMARPYRLIEHFRNYDLGVPEFYITECFVDNIFNSQSSWIKEAWKAKYNSPKYPDPRGVQAWEEYLKEMFPEMAFDVAIAHLLSHARKNIFYHGAFRGGCLFALNKQWGYPNGSNKEAGSNYEDTQFTRFRAELLPSVNAEIDEDTPMQLFPAKIKTPSSNIRATANGIVLSEINVPDWSSAMLSKSFVRVEGSPYNWHEIGYNDLRGFVADTSGFEFEFPVTELVYEVALGYATLRMNAQQVDWLATIFEGMAFAIRNAPRVE
jgi:hypothetical protein